MDIVSALGTVSQAISVAQSLRDLDRSVDAAAYKAKISEMYGALADVKMALTDAREMVHEKDATIRRLQGEIDDLKRGEVCPICSSGRLKVVASKPHEHFAFAGVQERTLACDGVGCSHSETRMHDPTKLTRGQ